jgi:uncharacterized membrane protein YbhN (UPF0104 family)
MLKYYLKKLFNIIISLICFVFFFKIFFTEISNLPSINLSFVNYLSLFISVIFILLVNFLASLNWKIVINEFYIKQSFLKLIYIFFVTNFYKYIPGNIGHYLGRLYFGKKNSLNYSLGVNSIILETVWFAIAAVIISLFSFNYINEHFFNGLFFNAPLVLILLSSLIIVTITYYILELIKKIKNLKVNNQHIFFKNITFRSSILILIIYIIYFLILSFIYYFILVSIFTIQIDFIILFSIISFSWLIGFISPGAPGGLGVREIIVLKLLSPIIPISVIGSASILFRVLCISGDLLSFIIGKLIKKMNNF